MLILPFAWCIHTCVTLHMLVIVKLVSKPFEAFFTHPLMLLGKLQRLWQGSQTLVIVFVIVVVSNLWYTFVLRLLW